MYLKPFFRGHAARLFLLACFVLQASAQVRLSIDSLPGGRVRISWPGAASFEVQQAVTVAGPWQPSGIAPQNGGGGPFVELPVAASAHFFRLREIGNRPLTIESSSPAPNETGVAVSRETIFWLSAPLGPDATLNATNLYATAAGRKILSRAELSSDRRKATLFYLERLPSDTRIEVTFNGTGLFDAFNRPVDLDANGVLGGSASLTFETLSTTSLSTTGIQGHVYASEKNPDGSNRPLQNVTITVDGMEETLRTTTDANGYFHLQPCPAGRFFVSVDGRTAEGSQWPAGAYYPFVGKAWEAAPGRTNNLAGGSGLIYLPFIQADALTPVSATNETRITFPGSVLTANPALAGVELTVPPNALFADTGSRGGAVGIAPVPADRLPEPLPPGLNLPIVITIQTDGPSNFDQPVPVRFPNLPDPITGLKPGPGEKTVLWSFNHDTGRWEPQGTMTITPDGQFAVTDPGVGVRQPGWHGAAPGSAGGGPGPAPGPGPGPNSDCEDLNGNGFCDQDDEKRCETDKLKTIFAGVDAFIGFVPQPDMGPLGSCLNGGAQSGSQAIRDCAIDPNGCRETVALKILDFSIDCGLSFVPGSKSFTESVKWIKRVKGLFDVGLAYANWDLCKKTPGSPLTRQAISVNGVPTIGNPFLQQYEVEMRLHRFVELAFGNAIWAEIDPTEWPLTGAMMAAIRSATQPGSEGVKTITPAERTTIHALRRPTLITLADVDALITRMEMLLSQQAPPGGDIDSAALQEAAADLSAILNEVATAGWHRAFDGYPRGAAILASLSQSGTVAVGVASPLARQSAPANNVPMPARTMFYRIVDLQTGFERFGRLNSNGRFDGMIFRPSAPHVVLYFDPLTGGAGIAYFSSQGAGTQTIIPGAALVRPPAALDTDGDGLSDVAEAVLGSSSSNADSDGDGVSDGAEIANGTDPVDGQGLTIGAVATRDTPGTAAEIDTVNDFALVADSASGLAVFDAANPLAPVLVDQFTAPGISFDAVSAAGEFVAAVPGGSAATARVHVFRLLNDGSLLASGSLPVGGVPETVLAAGRFLYAPGRSANAPTLAVVRLRDALLMRHVPVPGSDPVTALALDGDVLWALTESQLFSYRVAGDDLEPLGQLALANLRDAPLEPGPELMAGGGRVYVGDFDGIRVIDGSQPAAPVLLFTPATTQAGIHDLALNGSGLLVPITSFSGTSSLAVSTYDLANDQPAFLASFDTPGTARSVVLHRGYALASDGNFGLAVVNFLGADRGTNAPAITLRPFISHPGTGQESDQPFFVSTTTADDVQVRDVEFYLNGNLAARSGKYPFAATVVAPAIAEGRTTFTLRAKATDTGGNSTWSQEMTINLLPDVTAPRLLAVDPPNGSVNARGSVTSVQAVFDSVMDGATLQGTWTLLAAGSDNALGTADDVPASGSTVAVDPAERTVALRFNAPLLSGKYRSQLLGSMTDLGGNRLAATNVTWDFSIPTARAIATDPADKHVFLPGASPRIEARFDEKLNPASITTSSFRLVTTNQSNPVTVAGTLPSISADGSGAILDVPQPLANGTYRVLLTRDLQDVYGSAVETNFLYSFVVKGPALWTNTVNGIWTGATNWADRAVPVANDNVIIDVPGADPTISIRNNVTLTSIRSEEAVALDAVNGLLRVNDRAIFNGPLLLQNIGTGIEAKYLEVHGSVILNRVVRLGEDAWFYGDAAMTEGDSAFNNGRSHFYGKLDSTRTINLGAHTLILEPGSVATLRNMQVQFGGPNSAVLISQGGRLEIIKTNPQSRGIFIVQQGGSGARVLNAGDLVKKGPIDAFSGIAITNSGTIRVEEGSLNLGRGSENSGSIEVRSGTQLLTDSDFRHVGGRIFGEGLLSMPDNAVINAAYELTGTTRVTRAQSSAAFNIPIRSTGSWIITGTASFNGTSTELLGPVTIDAGRLILNSPGESIVANLQLTNNAAIGGTGQLRFSGGGTLSNPLVLQDSLHLRLEGPWTIATNLITTEESRVEITANSRFTGGSISGQVELLPNVELVLSNNNDRATVGLVFPTSGILRKVNTNLTVLQNVNGLTLTNSSLIEILAGSIRPSGTFYYQDAGRTHVAAGASLVAEALRLHGGELTGAGTVTVTSDSSNRGCHIAATVSPGEPYGKLSFTSAGAPIFQNNCVVVLDIAGSNPGVDHDQIAIERGIRINGGTLTIRTTPGFVPALGQEFTLFTFTSRQGTFPTVNGLDLGGGRKFRVLYENTAIKVKVE